MGRIFRFVILTVVVLVISLLFGQLLGGFYIYNLLIEDNHTEINKPQGNVQGPPVIKRKVLRLEPISYYTLQVGIYQDIKSAQDSIDKLVEMGFRPFVSSEEPYKVMLGCFSDKSTGKEMELYLQKSGFDAFLKQGLVNERALKFPGNNTYMQNHFAPLLGVYDIIFKHSLKMFQSPKISAYNEELWSNMIKKLQEELNSCGENINKLLKLEESANYEKKLKILQEKTRSYQNSLDMVLNAKTDKAVLYSQSYLLELIDGYHTLITETNEKLGIK